MSKSRHSWIMKFVEGRNMMNDWCLWKLYWCKKCGLKTDSERVATIRESNLSIRNRLDFEKPDIKRHEKYNPEREVKKILEEFWHVPYDKKNRVKKATEKIMKVFE